MKYEDAIRVMQDARIRLPALVKYGTMFHAFSGAKILGSGINYERTLSAAGLWPRAEKTAEEAVLFSNNGTRVFRGKEPICDARTRNYAHRIANALNAYTPNDEGY